MLLPSLPSLRALLVSALPSLFIPEPPQTPLSPSNVLTFTLRHQHAQSTDGRVVFMDVPEQAATQFSVDSDTAYTLKTRPLSVYRARSMEQFHRARRRLDAWNIPWDPHEVQGPDTSSRQTLSLLAKMTFNAYLDPEDKTWYDLGENWTVGYPFGWEPDQDGFRGHVFATPDNSTVVLSIKGTTAAWIGGGGGPTAKKDKLNDNLLFSCCCARVDWTWTTVCGCYGGGWKCDRQCVETALTEDSLFYQLGTSLYSNLTHMYPHSTIWLTGHSLGGALASLLGTTFGMPTVAFEAPGEALAASRLHLPTPHSLSHVTHVFHTADPIAMGSCTGVLSSCAIAGYAMESRCHLGNKILYDTVGELGWSVDVRTHPIANVIEKILNKPWKDVGGKVDLGEDGTPHPVPEDEDCASAECYSWEFSVPVAATNLTRYGAGCGQ